MSAASGLPSDLPGLLGELLADQAELSAVDVFSRRHDEGALPAVRVYEERIPVGRTPGPHEQLAFRVDLDRCTGCKACVTACHAMNGLAEEETWRDVGLLLGEGEGAGFQQTVTTACHHCEDPGCLAGCPVKAYEKDPVTGIVRHLDDQCIGCQYCLLKCPYDVPKYSVELGIVRKCDMCTGRLAANEAPACVQGCPNGAIAIEIVGVRGPGVTPELIPGTGASLPDAATTRPTTRYVTSRTSRPLRPANVGRLAPASAHDPLAVMLVGMQLSVGALLFDCLAAAAGAGSSLALALAAGAAGLGLGAATLHLGRPLYAFRAFLGWRTSWMSREILVFGGYVPVLALTAATALVAGFGAALPGLPPAAIPLAEAWLPPLRAAALALGLAGTLCSVMIYVDTRRPAWALPRTAALFGGSALSLGALALAAAWALECRLAGADAAPAIAVLAAVGLAASGAKLAVEWRLARRDAGEDDALSRSARLLRGPLRDRFRARCALAALGATSALGVLACAAGGAAGGALALSLSALAFSTFGEVVERHLYFTSEAMPAMPGH